MLPQRQTDADTFVNEFTDCTVHNKADVIAVQDCSVRRLRQQCVNFELSSLCLFPNLY